ncbi:MAG TPA: carbohydrate ABC transporter permease, partial [Armatimonadota bacterium]|nr:carbohydrate ABC transporter permease [Armatimonadota bacterium]
MNSLGALVSVGVAAACYVTAWAWALMLADAWRRRHWPAVALLLASGAMTLGLGLRGPFAYPARPLVFLPVAWLTTGLYYALIPRMSKGWSSRRYLRSDGRQIALHLVLASGCLLFALPYVWMVLTSLKPDDAIFKNPTALPEVWMWSNYPRTFQFLEVALGRVSTGFGSLFVLNTLQVTALSMAGMMFSSSLVAYSFARLRWPGRDVLFVVLLGTMMLPAAVTMIPRFIIFKELGWVDTLLPLWVPSLFANAFDVFLLRQFLMTIPTELEDAAKIDGCGYFTIYWRVMLPLIKPALAALAILHFLATWNDFMGPLVYLSSPEKMTGSYALRLFQSANSGEWALLLAAATLWTLPVVVLFFFAQRAFI